MTQLSSGHAARVGQELRTVFRDFLAYGLLTAISRAAGLLLLPILTRALAIAEYGAVDLIVLSIAALSTALEMGLPAALARFYAEARDRGSLDELMSSHLTLVFFGGGLAATILCLILGGVTRMLPESPVGQSVVFLAGGIALSRALLAIPEMVLRVERKILRLNLLHGLLTLLYVALAAWLVLERRGGVQAVFVAQLLATGTALGLALVLVAPRLTTRISGGWLRQSLRYSLPLMVGRLGLQVGAQVDRVLVVLFLGLPGVALLGAAAQVSRLLGITVELFQRAWQPAAMLSINDAHRDELYRRACNYYLGVSCIGGLLLVAISPELLRLLAPDSYHGAFVAVPWLAGASILGGATGFARLGILVSQRTWGITTASWAGAAVGAGTGWYLIPRVGFVGAAIAACVAQVVASSLLWRGSGRQSSVRLDATTIVRLLSWFGVASAVLVLLASAAGPLALLARTLTAAGGIAVLGHAALGDHPRAELAQLMRSLRKVESGD